MSTAPGPAAQAAAAVPASEAPKTTEGQTPPQSPPPTEQGVSERFSSAAKRERQAMKMRREAMALQQQVARERAEIQEARKNIQKFDKIRELARQNPLEYLQYANLKPEDINNFILNDNKPTPDLQVREVRDEIAQLRREREEEIKRKQEADLKSARQEVAEAESAYKERIGSFLQAAPDDYEFTLLYGEQDLVFDTQRDYYKMHKKLLSLKEAADLVESWVEKEHERGLATKKAKKRLTPAEEGKKEGTTTPQRAPTLTNAMTPPSTAVPSSLPARTEADRIARAIAALDGKR